MKVKQETFQRRRNYLTTIIDLADRKVVGWTLSEDMTVEKTVYQTWLLARKNRAISSNHIFHSDRGVQYASNKIKTLLGKNISISQSMSRKDNYWDNAVAESFFKTVAYLLVIQAYLIALLNTCIGTIQKDCVQFWIILHH